MSDHTRNKGHANLESAKAVCLGKAKSHPLQSHVDSVAYFDQGHAKEVAAEKPSSVASYRRKTILCKDGTYKKAWMPENQAALDVFAAMTFAQREEFMYKEPNKTHEQECESKAILGGSKIKGPPRGTKEQELFPGERTHSRPRGPSSSARNSVGLAVGDDSEADTLAREEREKFNRELTAKYSS